MSSKIQGASSEPLKLCGGIIVEISGVSESGKTVSTLQLMYVSESVTKTYLSLDTCIALGLVPKNFPCISEKSLDNHVDAIKSTIARIEHKNSIQAKCSNSGVVDSEVCKCPKRSPPPKDKPVLPCAPTKENLPIMKKYILDRYASSAFNTCQHQPLPLMRSSAPLKLYVDPDAKPVAVHTPAQIPLHWREAVKKGLDRDVQLGVLEPVPVNEPVTWCSRMVVTPKANGEPRRVVDFQALNNCAPR